MVERQDPFEGLNLNDYSQKADFNHKGQGRLTRNATRPCL
jgi:hypothetical protein